MNNPTPIVSNSKGNRLDGQCVHTLVEDTESGLVHCIKCNKAEVELLD